jgi:TusA-related sulfurtransferase
MTTPLVLTQINATVANLNPNMVVTLNTNNPITLKNIQTFSGSAGKFAVEELTNVTVVERIQNSTLSYSELNNKYEIRQLTLDGGSF